MSTKCHIDPYHQHASECWNDSIITLFTYSSGLAEIVQPLLEKWHDKSEDVMLKRIDDYVSAVIDAKSNRTSVINYDMTYSKDRDDFINHIRYYLMYMSNRFMYRDSYETTRANKISERDITLERLVTRSPSTAYHSLTMAEIMYEMINLNRYYPKHFDDHYHGASDFEAIYTITVLAYVFLPVGKYIKYNVIFADNNQLIDASTLDAAVGCYIGIDGHAMALIDCNGKQSFFNNEHRESHTIVEFNWRTEMVGDRINSLYVKHENAPKYFERTPDTDYNKILNFIVLSIESGNYNNDAIDFRILQALMYDIYDKEYTDELIRRIDATSISQIQNNLHIFFAIEHTPNDITCEIIKRVGLNNINNNDGTNLISFMIKNDSNRNLLIKLITDYDYDFSQRLKYGESTLQLAISVVFYKTRPHNRLMYELINRGYDPNHIDDNSNDTLATILNYYNPNMFWFTTKILGNTYPYKYNSIYTDPVYMVCDKQLELALLRLIFDAGYDISKQYEGKNVIVHMIKYDMSSNYISEVAKIMGREKLSIRDNLNLTPLHHAILSHNLKTLKALVDAGANTTVLDSKGKTILAYAIFNGAYPYTIEYLWHTTRNNKNFWTTDGNSDSVYEIAIKNLDANDPTRIKIEAAWMAKN